MFLFILTYQKPIQDVELYLDAHREYLKTNYDLNLFVASGRQEPRVGGVIICRAKDKKSAIEIMESDPFYINKIAKYEVIEFVPTMYVDGFEKFI